MTKPLWLQIREAFERNNYFPPSPELRDEWVGIATDYADQKTAAARAEIERLNNALTEAANQISDLATRLGRAEGRLDASELVGVVEGWKARAEKAEAEVERLREALQPFADEAAAWENFASEEPLVEGFNGYSGQITVADCRHALAALRDLKRGSDNE